MFSQTIALASRRRTISSQLDGAFAYLSRLHLIGTYRDDIQLGEGAGTPNDESAKRSQPAPATLVGRSFPSQASYDFHTIVYAESRRTSFQSPPSMGGRSRANGMPNFLASDWCRSAKRSPGPLASVALQKSASGSLAISTSSVSSATIVPGPMPPPVAT